MRLMLIILNILLQRAVVTHAGGGITSLCTEWGLNQETRSKAGGFIWP